MGDLLGQLDSLSDLVGSGLDRALNRSVVVSAAGVSLTESRVNTHCRRFRNLRFFAYVKGLLKQLDQAELDSHIDVRAFLSGVS